MNTDPRTSASPRGRALKWLALAAIVTSAVALVAQGLSGGNNKSFKPRLAFPEIETSMADIARIEIQSKDAHFTLVKIDGENSWGVLERGNYPVRASELKTLLWGLGDMNLVEQKTARADRHQTVGLMAPEDGGDGVRIRAFEAEDAALAAAIFGIPVGAETLDGSLRVWLRMDGEDQTFIGEGRFEVEAELEEWMDLDVLDVDVNRVARVRSTPGDVSQGGEVFVVARPDQDSYDFELQGLHGGETMSGPTAANGLGRALRAMTFSDAMRASEIGFDDAAAARFETFDGLVLTLNVRRFEENFWVTLAAETFALPEETSADEAAESAEPAIDIAAEAGLINKRAAGWAFRIPEWKGDQLTIARASMIKQASDESNKADDNE